MIFTVEWIFMHWRYGTMTDRLEALICRTVIYTVNDQDGTFTGTVERDGNGRAYIAGE